MNNFLRGGRGLPIVYTLPMILFCVLFSNVFAQSAGERTAVKAPEITSLNIGDKVPDEVWEMPLDVINHPEGKDAVTLSNYRGKLLILDFWATWCSSCLKFMPYMDKLEEEMGGVAKVIAITSQDKPAIQRFLERSIDPQIQATKKSFFSILNGRAMYSYFPIESLPYVVVIDPKGVVRALTVPPALNKDNLNLLLSDPDAKPIIKNTEFLNAPLFRLPDIKESVMYYSTVFPYNPELPIVQVLRRDSVANYTHFYSMNTRVIKLLNSSISEDSLSKIYFGLHVLPSRRILVVKDPSYYNPRNNTIPPIRTAFSYEQVSPLTYSNYDVKAKMKDDLKEYLGVTANLEEMEIPCLVLRVKDQKRIPFARLGLEKKYVNKGRRGGDGTSEGRYEQLDVPDRKRSNTYLQNYTISQLVYLLNHPNEGALPFVIDETGILEKLDLDLVDTLTDLKALGQVLEKQGFVLEHERRVLPMFVLRETNYSAPSDQLLLTPHGYIYAQKEGGNQ